MRKLSNIPGAGRVEQEVSEDELTPEEIVFCRAVATGKTPDKALQEAGLDTIRGVEADDRKIAELLLDKRIQGMIRSMLAARALSMSARALERAMELSQGARSEKVSLEASLAILDRAGLAATSNASENSTKPSVTVRIVLD